MLKLDQLNVVLVMLVCTLIYLAPYSIGATGAAANYRNVTVLTQLNITNSIPEVLTTTLPANVTLNAGITTPIQCNATVRDYEGIGTVTVNATFFDENAIGLLGPEDNNHHYINSSCTRYENNSIEGNFTCIVNVQYYANNGTNWNCTVQATDDKSITGLNFNGTTIEPLLAVNVTPGTFDYGNMDVGDISNTTVANVSNIGNVNINVTVRGFGFTEGDGLAMVCDFNNIPIDQERFSINDSAWSIMDPLSGSDQILNLTLVQRTDDSPSGIVRNATYWRIRVPSSSNPSGQCNGSIVFQAELV